MIDIYDFYTKMQQSNIMLSFKGEITSDLLTSILHITENKLDKMQEEPKVKKKVFNVLVECLQNLYHHIDEMKSIDQLFFEEIIGESESKAAILMIGKDGANYYILTGNYILNDKVDAFKKKLEKINSLSKEELKLMYQEILNNEGFSQKGGGGLGMIDIVRKSGQKLEFEFQNINENFSFFSLHIKISL
jgi:hypothetical protein